MERSNEEVSGEVGRRHEERGEMGRGEADG